MSISDKPVVSGQAGASGITRRDFLHDLSLASLALGTSSLGVAAMAETGALGGSGAMPAHYPPALTGMRGAHPGAFEVAHQLAREGRVFEQAKSLNEHYDLVVVGAGISGLAAAYFYRKQYGPDARILLLDNHDDFGGHAKRNEFHQGGPMQLVWGGTVNIEYHKYSDVGVGLLRELGVDVPRLLEDFRFNWSDSGTGLGVSCWFDKARYGRDVLIRGFSLRDMDRERLLAVVPQIPIPMSAQASLQRFLSLEDDLLPDLSPSEKIAFTHATRYEDFLRDYGKLEDEAIQIFSGATMGGWGIRAEDLSVAECLQSGLPGSHVLGLAIDEDQHEAYPPSAMFPDGNASIARLLVRQLIPGAFPDFGGDRDPFEIVTAGLDYAQLDQGASPVRLRLSSTVVEARNTPEGKVSVRYVSGGKAEAEVFQLSADRCIMACYNRIIPYLCPELSAGQKDALAQCIKRPMVVVNVLLRDGQAIQRSGIAEAYLPGRMLQRVNVVSGINVGPYRSDWDPAEPCTLQFFAAMGAENPKGLSMSEQNQAGRLRLLQMAFADFEAEVHAVLRGVWGGAGLDPDTDITALTVNRWPHGYARDLPDLEDPAWRAIPGPYEIGRQPFGNIAIANSDSGADAYTHTAIDQAWRAVNDLPGRI